MWKTSQNDYSISCSAEASQHSNFTVDHSHQVCTCPCTRVCWYTHLFLRNHVSWHTHIPLSTAGSDIGQVQLWQRDPKFFYTVPPRIVQNCRDTMCQSVQTRPREGHIITCVLCGLECSESHLVKLVNLICIVHYNNTAYFYSEFATSTICYNLGEYKRFY